MVKNILCILRDWLIKLIGGYTETDVEMEKGIVRSHALKRLAEEIRLREKADENYMKATERIRHMLELEAFGYTKKDRIMARRDELLHGLWTAMRREALEYFDRWEDLDNKPVRGVRQ